MCDVKVLRHTSEFPSHVQDSKNPIDQSTQNPPISLMLAHKWSMVDNNVHDEGEDREENEEIEEEDEGKGEGGEEEGVGEGGDYMILVHDDDGSGRLISYYEKKGFIPIFDTIEKGMIGII